MACSRSSRFAILLIAAAGCGTNSTTGTSGATDVFTIGGDVAGLSGAGLVLTDNGADDRAITSNGAFTFATPLASAASYHVTVKTQPSGQTCSVSNGSGSIAGANVTNVQVTCSSGAAPSLVGSWTTSGLGVIPGTVVLTFTSSGGYTVDALSTAGVDVTGTYVLGDPDAITYTDTSGAQACDSGLEGTYTYAISGSTLTFTLVSDTCAGRMAAMAKTWTLQ